VLLDSNIIIYAAQPEHSQLRELIAEHSPAVSALSYLEVLGDHRLTEPQRQYFEEFFSGCSSSTRLIISAALHTIHRKGWLHTTSGYR